MVYLLLCISYQVWFILLLTKTKSAGLPKAYKNEKQLNYLKERNKQTKIPFVNQLRRSLDWQAIEVVELIKRFEN